MASPPLLGREQELRQVLALLGDPSVALVSLTGRSGVGKTRLAIEVASEWNGPTHVVDCARVQLPDLLLPAIATALDVPLDPNAAVADVLERRLQTSDALVIIDGCEHLAEGAGALGALAERVDATFLVTTQAPLRLEAERVLRLAPLPVPPEDLVVPDDLARQPAVALYCSRAAAVDGSFALTDENARAIALLVRELEGLPLAIELAAARAVSLPALEILAQLQDHRLDVLRAARRDRPSRHHDLRSAIAWTYALLPPDEAQLLQRLSIITSPFDVQDVEALGVEGASPLDALSSLVDLNLVDRAHGEPRSVFVLVRSIRAFAREQLDAAGEAVAVEERWRGWLAQRARSAALGIDSSEERRWRWWLRRTHDELVAALATSVAAKRVDDALHLLCGLAPYWDQAGLLHPHNRLMDDAIELATLEGCSTVAFGEVLLWSARFGLRHRRGPDRAVAAERLERGQAIARSLGDPRLLLHAFATRMVVVPATGEIDKATEAASEGLTLARRHGSRWTARFEVWAAMLAHQTGDNEQARALARAGLELARRGRDHRTVVLACMVLAPIARNHPDLAAELPSLEAVLTMARMSNQTVIQAFLLPMLAADAAGAGDVSRAATFCREGLEIASGLSGPIASGCGMVAAIEIAAAAGDFSTAARFHGMIRDSWPTLLAYLPHEYIDSHALVLGAAKEALGDDEFTAFADQGAAVDGRAGVHAALAYVRGLEASRSRSSAAQPSRRPRLSSRQLDVLRLLAQGHTNKEIAQRLALTPKTVMHHTSDIYRKLQVRGRSEAVSWATRAGVLDDSS